MQWISQYSTTTNNTHADAEERRAVNVLQCTCPERQCPDSEYRSLSGLITIYSGLMNCFDAALPHHGKGTVALLTTSLIAAASRTRRNEGAYCIIYNQCSVRRSLVRLAFWPPGNKFGIV